MTDLRAGQPNAEGENMVAVLNAGVLHHFVANGLIPAMARDRGIAVRHESGPSVSLARQLRDGGKVGDVFLSADAEVNRILLESSGVGRTRWYVGFARNAVVLVYSPKSRYASEFSRAAAGEVPWFEILQRANARLVRGDPNQDPLAYYTLLVVELAERHYGVPGLRQRILGDDLNPVQLSGFSFAGLETGDVDAIFLYRSMALDRQLPFVALPDAVNLGDPAQAESYSRARFTTNQGETFAGGPIRLGATVLSNAASPELGAEVVAYLLSPDGQKLLAEYQFLPADGIVGGDPTALPATLEAQRRP
jgi:molybdate/tungstate transport system substrate-binding protein